MVALHPHLHMVEGVQCLLTEVERLLTAEVAPACLRHRTVVDTLVVDLEAAAALAASVAAVDTRPPVVDLTAAVVAEDTTAVGDTMAVGTTELPRSDNLSDAAFGRRCCFGARQAGRLFPAFISDAALVDLVS